MQEWAVALALTLAVFSVIARGAFNSVALGKELDLKRRRLVSSVDREGSDDELLLEEKIGKAKIGAEIALLTAALAGILATAWSINL
jgi:hypothetical protein